VNHRISGTRILVVLGLILASFGAIAWRLFDISWQQHALYAQTAQAQAQGISNILMRGNIYLTDLVGQEHLVATNKKFPTLKGKKTTDEQAADGYVTDRFYPAGMLAADVIGFLGYGPDGRVGQYGVEASYDQELSGHSGGSSAIRWDILGQLRRIVGLASSSQSSDDVAPQDIVLTLDTNIQAYAQTTLENVLKKYHAASGVLLVQEPMTGRMLAMADSPSFDPNNYGSTPVGNFADSALAQFEPGSSFKPFTMATGLDIGKVTPNTIFDDEGDVVVDGYTIKNFNEGHFGRVTMTKVLEKSINTGAMWVQQQVGNDTFLNYVVNMGFGQRTGIDLPDESSGNISNLYTGRRINFMTAAFGQGIAVTPLQLINGYSAIANGGNLMRPYVNAAMQPEIIGTPFTAKTAATLRTMLTSVVDNGFDKARIPRYDVAGKTGTAQIASPQGGYLDGQYNHSFVGFAPASNPKFVILIKMEKPQGITFAADSLSPVFKDMALFLLDYYAIPPTR
jgi:cell division protein FtsI/penicillin-binding protein 2